MHRSLDSPNTERFRPWCRRSSLPSLLLHLRRCPERIERCRDVLQPSGATVVAPAPSAGASPPLLLLTPPPHLLHMFSAKTVWAHVRRKVSRQSVESKEGMKRRALAVFKSSPALASSFFQQSKYQ